MSELKLGDIIISNTKTPISQTIKLLTGKRFGHVSIVAKPGMTLETDIRTNNFYLEHYEYYNALDHYVMRPKVSKEQRLRAADKALSYIGRRYGRNSLINLITNHFTGHQLPKSFHEDQYACSCMVNASYNNLFGKKGEVFPWTILKSDQVSFVQHKIPFYQR